MQSGAPMQRPLQRPVFNDFSRPARPIDPSMRPATPTTPLTPVTPTQPVTTPAVHQPAHHPQPTAPTSAASLASALRPATFADPTVRPPQTPVTPPATVAQASVPDLVPTSPVEVAPVPPVQDVKHTSKHAGDTQSKHKNEDGHSGLVGFLSFVLLCALFFAPFLPGKVLDNFPGSSASFSTGDQALACITELGPMHSSLKYDTKMGFPITYNYSTTTTQTATCKGVSQSAVGGHTAQLNPLGGLIDAFTAFVIAFAIAKIWRRIFKNR